MTDNRGGKRQTPDKKNAGERKKSKEERIAVLQRKEQRNTVTIFNHKLVTCEKPKNCENC